MTSAVPTPQPALLPPCPLDAVRSKVDSALALGRSLVLQAEPGAGKSTRLPLWLLAAPWLRQHDKQGRILLLEPRRVAARALARYLARALDEDVGRTVGLRMRDETRVSHATKLEVLTEGVLTRLLQADPQLTDTACVIFDEFHERSLTSDTGLALCLESQAALRPDLRLVVMSATLDAAPVAALLGNCPVVTCPGRAYPVDIRYLPPRPETTRSPGGAPLLWRHMAAVIGELCRTEPGGLLAFLPGAGEIRQVAALLEGRLPPHTDLYPLYGNLSPQAQDAALAPSPPGRRKVVLATAIAETSLTIDGVRMVVDCGLARLARFDPASGLTRLVTERVSLAGAVQRAGRAGRTEPGLCCRLWRHAEDHGLRPTARPEILEADLCGLTLQLAVWGAEPTALPWLDPPPAAALTAARQTLQRLGALDPRGRATALGRRMAALPLDPRPARMLLGAQDQGHGPLACCLAALLAERDPLARAEAPQRAAGSIMRENSADLGKRLDWLCRPARAGRQDRSPLSDGMGHGGGAQARLRRQALRLAGLLRLKEDIFAVAAADHKHAGPVLARTDGPAANQGRRAGCGQRSPARRHLSHALRPRSASARCGQPEPQPFSGHSRGGRGLPALSHPSGRASGSRRPDRPVQRGDGDGRARGRQPQRAGYGPAANPAGRPAAGGRPLAAPCFGTVRGRPLRLCAPPWPQSAALGRCGPPMARAGGPAARPGRRALARPERRRAADRPGNLADPGAGRLYRPDGPECRGPEHGSAQPFARTAWTASGTGGPHPLAGAVRRVTAHCLRR